MQTLLVITHCPDANCAATIAQAVVEARLAACVNILPAVESIYRWQGKIETSREIPLLIKTTNTRYGALATLILEQHPYDLPEIIALPVECGLPAYLNWVATETTSP